MTRIIHTTVHQASRSLSVGLMLICSLAGIAANAQAKDQPCKLSAKAKATEARCYGTASGSISVKTVGGSGHYTYSVNGGLEQSSNVFHNLPAGYYRVEVRDGGCTAAVRSVVVEPEAITAISSVAPASCFGYANGELTVMPTGGTNGYTYAIGTAVQKSNSFTRLSPGTYSVKVTDGKGCSVDITASVPEAAMSQTLAVNTK